MMAPGYYWVKWMGATFWSLAYFNGKFWKGVLPGQETFTTEEVGEIGPNIEPPELVL